MKKMFFTFGGFVVFLVFSFIIVEVFLRVYSKFSPTFFAPKNKAYDQFRPNPNSWINGFQLNSKGYQDEEFSIQKKEGTFRILAIGDSFTFGVVPYKNNFVTIIEERLKEIKPSIEIINMGIPSTNVQDYLSLLIDEGLELNPDMIMINVYIGNDITYASQSKKESSIYTIRFINYLKAFFKFNRNGEKVITRLGGDNKENLYNDEANSMDDHTFMEVQKSLFFIYLDKDYILKELTHRYDSIFKDLNTLNQICQDRKIKLLITLLPAEIQVDKNLQKIIEAEVYKDLSNKFDSHEKFIESIHYSLPNAKLKNELTKQNIEYLDLLDPFQKKGLSKKFYKPKDTHWNIAGNMLAADLIYEYLLKVNFDK
jgi:lysophospholipase L1-like esterase